MLEKCYQKCPQMSFFLHRLQIMPLYRKVILLSCVILGSLHGCVSIKRTIMSYSCADSNEIKCVWYFRVWFLLLFIFSMTQLGYVAMMANNRFRKKEANRKNVTHITLIESIGSLLNLYIMYLSANDKDSRFKRETLNDNATTPFCLVILLFCSEWNLNMFEVMI